MIVIMEGRPGSGKSYVAVNREMCLDLAKGSIVVTNIDVCPEKIRERVLKDYGIEIETDAIVKATGQEIWDNFSKITPMGTREVPNKLYFDECHHWINARDWKRNHENAKAALLFATNHRHYHIDIILITQDALNIDSQFRRLVQFFKRYRDLARVRLPVIGKIWPFPHTLEIIIDYDGKTKMAQSIIPRKSDGFELYQSHQQMMDLALAPFEKRANIRINKKKKASIVFHQLANIVLIFIILICVYFLF